jgi:hypothetical protein
LIERIRKRKCFADKDLEKLAPNPNEENVYTINQASGNVTQEFPKRQKFKDIRSPILDEPGNFSCITRTDDLQKHLITNIINSDTFNSTSSFNALHSWHAFAAYYTQFLNSNPQNNMKQSQLNANVDCETKQSAFYEPTNNRKSYPDEKGQIQSEINLQFTDRNYYANENAKLSRSPLVKENKNEILPNSNKKANKFSNFSVEALLGVI